MKKKVLLLTITAGEGHTAPGKAILAQCEKLGMETKIIDCFKGYNKLLFWAFDKPYRYVQAREWLHWTYENSYRKSQFAGFKYKNKGATFLAVNSVVKKIAKDVEAFKPDVIICPHPTAARIAIEMKLHYEGVAPIIAIATDILSPPTWEKSSDADYLVKFTEEDDAVFYFKGFKRQQLKSFGMPARPAFNELMERKEAKKKLGLANKTTIMLYFMVGKPTKLVKELDKVEGDFQIVHVSGRNEKQKAILDKMIAKGMKHHVVSLGFTTNMQEWMAASDFLVGKPGMNFLNEALMVNNPLIVVGKMIGQEADNVNHLKSHNAIFDIPNKKNFAQEMDKIIKNPALLDDVRKNIANIRKPNATRDIANLALECANKYSETMIKRPKALKRKKPAGAAAMAPKYTETLEINLHAVSKTTASKQATKKPATTTVKKK